MAKKIFCDACGEECVVDSRSSGIIRPISTVEFDHGGDMVYAADFCAECTSKIRAIIYNGALQREVKQTGISGSEHR